MLFGTMVGFIHRSQLRAPGHALLNSSFSLLAAPANFWSFLKALRNSNKHFETIWKFQRLSFIPVMVLLLFFVLYSFADPEFNQVSDTFLSRFAEWLSDFFGYISFSSMLFFIAALLISSAILFNRDIRFIVSHEIWQQDNLSRKKNSDNAVPQGMTLWQLFFKKTMVALKNEYKRGLILMFLVNALLLFVNVVDVKMVWFEHSAIVSPYGRSQAVHESTYLLIFSILLAMCILLFFFRGNLNFLKRNERLKQLAWCWILQNTMLAVTAGIRNYYYISDYGLAYKRIGVLFFLLLTLVGLFTLALKIRDRKSFFYLYRINGWSACAVLVVMSCFNWDPLIASYNLNNFSKEKLDRDFLMSLSHRALPVLIQHKDVFVKEETSDATGISKQASWLQERRRAFMHSYESKSWLSWNYADDRVYHFLASQNEVL